MDRIFGVSGVLAVAIPFVVNFLKSKFKLSTKLAPVIAVVIGVIGGLIAFYSGFIPDLTIVEALMAGVAVGGTSTGLYDITKKLRGK